ncbi:MAG: DUF3090 family protein [Chloroflexi bacterium]|nr:DUF3090 family protein [Chloroflexota bacterium]
MPRFEIDVDPCDHITADAIGKPGQRVFYLQAYQDTRTITIIIEKAQLISLAIGIEQFLAQISRANPHRKRHRAITWRMRCASTRLWIRSSAPGRSGLATTANVTAWSSSPRSC